MPKSLQAALVPIVIILLSGIATKLQIDAKTIQDNVLVVATAVVALLVAFYGWMMTHLEAKKVDRAETLSPGITSVPKGSEVTTSLKVNDPTTPDPPVVTTKETLNSK